MSIEGHTGDVQLFDDKVQVIQPGLFGEKTKEIPLENINGVPFTPAGSITTGIIEFQTMGLESIIEN